MFYYNGTVGDLNIDFNTDYYTNTSTGKGLYHEVSQEQESRDVHTQSYIRNKLLASKLYFLIRCLEVIFR